MIKFKQISALGASALMVGLTMGVAAAAAFPNPYALNAASQTAVVSGTGSGVDDTVATNDIADYLATQVKTSGGTQTISGGDSVLLALSSDNLNLGNTWGVKTGSIDEDDLATVLADGNYVADDNDEFNYEQSVSQGSPTFAHFRDSTYEGLIGVSTKTPTLGFRLTSNTWVMNYTLDFTEDAESDIVSGDLDDIEGSDIIMMGKTYYVSDLKNGTSSTYLGKMTLLDSANIATVDEDGTSSVTSAGKHLTFHLKLRSIISDEYTYCKIKR